MSLMRLLSAGKSLIGVTESTSRYRMGKSGMMPKFGSGKNPFRSGVKQAEGQGGLDSRPPSSASNLIEEEKQERRAASATTPVTKSTSSALVEALPKTAPIALAATRKQSDGDVRRESPAGSAVSDDAKAPVDSVFRLGPSRATRSMPGSPAALRAIFGSWLDGIKARIPVRATGQARMATARAANAPMQGELSLDRIKVVRNDLSDTDFEIASREPSLSRREGSARANDLRTALKAEPRAGVDTDCARRPSGRLDDFRQPATAASGQNPMSEPAAGVASCRAAGSGWFASVQR
jgi:hypothetical protein